MKFCIATIEYWQSVGFDTEDWRTSIDGLKAICHDKFALTLVNDINNTAISIYDIDSEEFKRILSEEFTDREDIIEEGEDVNG